MIETISDLKVSSSFSKPSQPTSKILCNITRLYCWSLLYLWYQNSATDNSPSTMTTLSWRLDNKNLTEQNYRGKRLRCHFTSTLRFEVYFIFQSNLSSNLYPIARALGLSLLHLTFVKMICTISRLGIRVRHWNYRWKYLTGFKRKIWKWLARFASSAILHWNPTLAQFIPPCWNCASEFLVLVQFAKIISLIC